VRLLTLAISAGVIVAGGVGLGLSWPWSPYVVALTIAALLGVGLRNAWDLLLQMDGAPDAAAASIDADASDASPVSEAVAPPRRRRVSTPATARRSGRGART
jgi:hypothetical protein